MTSVAFLSPECYIVSFPQSVAAVKASVQETPVRRDTTQTTVFFSARVSSSDKEEFKHLLPLHGAQTACISIALEKFLDRIEQEHDCLQFVHEAIQRHLHEETRGGQMEELTIHIPVGLYQRFNQLVPEVGGTSWFIRRTLQALNRQLAEFVLDERIEMAVRSILQGTYGTVESASE
jgi:hypothetical protein